MHPIERLRYVARAGDADPALLAEEAAEALGSLAREPRALVPACRRLLEFHPTCGPLWWVCARLLVADDLWEASASAAAALAEDPTADELAATFPAGATIAASSGRVVVEALSQRPDITARVIGPPSALRSALRHGDGDVTGYDTSEADEAISQTDLVVVDVLAAGPSGFLLDHVAHEIATAADRSGVELWLACGEGTVLPSALYDALVRRSELLDDDVDDDEDDDTVLRVDFGAGRRQLSPHGRFTRRAVAHESATARAVIGPLGPTTPDVGLRRSSCLAPAELLAPPRTV